ncbi:hypothetical protein GCM10027566_05830 [Arachidicoccus ginsenosidivorans]|uniref:DUF4974 domain-containing protein n=1 Tax=Arachidicoccus ginsenosidivorans TaxID=496057 RepID=A0A5B8VSE6_9BACT|nr:FecR domain-containing protein [Arachidicoccus ginsenosidivorans]QEC74041.1 DUF4974 domain-containing protein [Arachidicoccus ginsenosidivorans]
MMVIDYDKILMLYLERLTGTISPEEDAWLTGRLLADPEVQQIWAQIEREGHAIDLQLFTESLSASQSLNLLKESIKTAEPEVRRFQKITWKKRWAAKLSIAASILLLFGYGWFYYNHHKKITDTNAIVSLITSGQQPVSLQLSTGKKVYLNNKTPQKIAVGKTVLAASDQNLAFSPGQDTSSNLLVIPKGENYQITLSDGTEVILNASSSLKFPFHFGRATRDVYLTGEAYFKVAKDKQHPFIVHTPLTQVQVVGTQFNINSYETNRVTTALIEGKVLTSTKGESPVDLNPGHAAVYTTTRGFTVKPVDTQDVISWIKGVYYFHDLTLQTLAGNMSRIYNVEITIDNASIAAKSVSGILDRSNLPALLEDLKTTMGIQYYYSQDKLHIK